MKQRSHLLINEPPLFFQPTLAQIIGVNEAIVLQQVHYWLSNPKAAGRIGENGEKWIYNTYDQWHEDNFPFWNVDKIQRIFLKLEELGVIISAKLDAKKRDMTKFYRIDYEKLCAMDDSFLRPSIDAKNNDVKMNTETTTENMASPLKTDELPLDWQVAGGVEELVLPDNEFAKRMDFANLVAMGTPNPPAAYAIAMAFQEERGITMPEGKVKGQRKAIKEMLEMKVTDTHVREATRSLMEKGMTVSDLFSVVRTAIDLANKPQKPIEYTRLL